MSYPLPADVRLGVQYGPTGTEYTGTLVAGFASRMNVTLTTQRLSVIEKPKKQAQQIIAPTTQPGNQKSKSAYAHTCIPRYQVLTSPNELWVRTNKETI